MTLAKIYLVTNTVTKHQYVGVTKKSVEERWIEHLNDARSGRNPNRPLCRAILKHGKEAFIIEEVYTSPDYNHTLTVMEPFFIKQFGSRYNATSGGDGVPGYHHTEETKRKCGMTMKGKHQTEYQKRRASEANKGKKLSLEHINRVKTALGRPINIDGKTFPSRNEAARYLRLTYGLSRNTALRRIERGITDFHYVRRYNRSTR